MPSCGRPMRTDRSRIVSLTEVGTLEMRDHTLEDVLETARLPLEGLVASIRPDASAAEIRLDRMKHLGAITVLTDGEAWPHLPPDEQRCSGRDRNGEASFSVDITGDIRREELTTVVHKGRRLITLIDCHGRFRLSCCCRTELRSHGHDSATVLERIPHWCGRASSRSVVTGSIHRHPTENDFPRDYPFAMTTSLKASRTRRASPLLAGLSTGVTSSSGNSITRQGISLP